MKANANAKVSIKINRKEVDPDYSREGSISKEVSVEPARFRINSNQNRATVKQNESSIGEYANGPGPESPLPKRTSPKRIIRTKRTQNMEPL